ncbi:hypothetical protein Ataiwa_20240 [Algoriphagus taiwanensis]|uniref:Uncharacterized protein n=1 Tax=Algoriphagus taiwanensis TaxID=1445656 RepID=A0ABQ6Q0P3_9BACT|nr:hypothetical protein Ataiwa_20240 [Algoriphagus taiwanensis]
MLEKLKKASEIKSQLTGKKNLFLTVFLKNENL